MTNTALVTVAVPSWDGEKDSFNSSYSVVLSGATENIDGGTYIKKNTTPASDDDYDVMCDSHGNLNGEYPLTDVTSVYIWGCGYTLDGLYFDCEPTHDNATEIEIAEDTEIMLWGVNSNP